MSKNTKFTEFFHNRLNENSKRVIFNSSSDVTIKPLKKEKEVIERAEGDEEEIQGESLNLEIKLNDFSPFQNAFGFRWREQIDISAFEKSVPIEKQEIVSYLDHNMSIEYTLASTVDGSMIVKKKDNVISAQIPFNEKSDPLLLKTVNLVNRKIVKSNSFIFKAMGVHEVEKKDDEGSFYEVTYTDCELISIDPVYAGFYPQNNTSVKQKELNMINNNTNTNEINQEEEVNLEVKNPTPKVEEVKSPVVDVVEVKQVIEPNEVEQEIKELIKERKDNLALEIKKSQVVDKLDYLQVKNKFMGGEKLTKSELLELNKDYLELKKSNNVREIEALSLAFQGQATDTLEVIERSLDGTSSLNGLALIEVIKNPSIITEWALVFPEIVKANKVPLVNLNKVEQDILLPAPANVDVIAEGASSTDYSSETITVPFSPLRRSIRINQNNALNRGPQVMVLQTNTVKDNIKQSIRKDFYTNMFKNVGSNLNKSTYDGGATLESVIKTQGGLQIADLERVHTELVSKYGDQLFNIYSIAMHPDVWTHLQAEYFSATNNNNYRDIFDGKNMTYRGIKIILSPYMTNTIEDKKNVVIFYNSSSVVAYGLNMVIMDESTLDISKDQRNRFIKTRGEMKLTDPYFATRVLQVNGIAAAEANVIDAAVDAPLTT